MSPRAGAAARSNVIPFPKASRGRSSLTRPFPSGDVRRRSTKPKPKPRLSAHTSTAKTADVLAADAVIARARRILARDRGGREIRASAWACGVPAVAFTYGHRNLVVAPDEVIAVAGWLVDREPWVDPLRWRDPLPVRERKVRVCCYTGDRFSQKGWAVEAVERKRAQARARRERMKARDATRKGRKES
jgi:hypothetical protein